MKTKVLGALIALNVLLLAAFIGQLLKPNVVLAAGGRRPAYIMVPGEVIGGANSIVYILDTENRRLGARSLDSTGRNLVDMAPIELDRIFEDQNDSNPRR